jgi:hypothetical protein
MLIYDPFERNKNGFKEIIILIFSNGNFTVQELQFRYLKTFMFGLKINCINYSEIECCAGVTFINVKNSN